MASIKLNDFKGLTPRTGEQLLDPGHAVGATNVDLDSGALRPLITPHREKVFPRAGEPGFLSPNPVDPSDPPPVDPTDPGIPGVPVPPACVPVVIVTPPADQTFTYLPDDITFTAAINAGATVPVVVRWYIDDVLIAGESELTLTISPHDLQVEYNNGELVLSPNIPVITSLYGVIKVVVQNPCGIAEAFCTVQLINEYNCDAFYQYVLSTGGGTAFGFPDGQNDYLSAEYAIGNDQAITPAQGSIGQLLQPIPSSSAYRKWRMDLAYPRCGTPGEIVYGLGTYANPTTQFGPGFSVPAGIDNLLFVTGGGLGTMTVFGGLYGKRVYFDYLNVDGNPRTDGVLSCLAAYSNGDGGTFYWHRTGLSNYVVFPENPVFRPVNFWALSFGIPSIALIPGTLPLEPERKRLSATFEILVRLNEQVFSVTSTYISGSNYRGLSNIRTSGFGFLSGTTANLAVIAGRAVAPDVDQAYQAFLNNFQGDPS